MWLLPIVGFAQIGGCVAVLRRNGNADLCASPYTIGRNAPAAAKIKGEPLRDASARQRRHPHGWRPVVLIEL
jgi:hypothetical protein